jgi:hypothetical protein
MPNYNSTKQFLEAQIRNLTNAMNPDKVLRQAVVTLVPEMKNRIQQDGKLSNGGKITSPSPEKFGAYSEGYGKKRQKKGYQTNHIDLTFKNDMMRDLKPGPTGPMSYGVGFLSNEQRKIAGFNEERFGAIFDPTDQELKQSLVTINKAITKILSK